MTTKSNIEETEWVPELDTSDLPEEEELSDLNEIFLANER